MQSQSPPSRPQRAKQHSPGHPPWTPIHPLGFQFRFERHGGVVSRADTSVGDRDAATYNMRGFPRFDHFVGQKTWEFFSRRNGCNGQLDRNSRFVRTAAKNGASSSQSCRVTGAPQPLHAVCPNVICNPAQLRVSAPAALVPTSLPWSSFCSNSLLRRISCVQPLLQSSVQRGSPPPPPLRPAMSRDTALRDFFVNCEHAVESKRVFGSGPIGR